MRWVVTGFLIACTQPVLADSIFRDVTQVPRNIDALPNIKIPAPSDDLKLTCTPATGPGGTVVLDCPAAPPLINLSGGQVPVQITPTLPGNSPLPVGGAVVITNRQQNDVGFVLSFDGNDKLVNLPAAGSYKLESPSDPVAAIRVGPTVVRSTLPRGGVYDITSDGKSYYFQRVR